MWSISELKMRGKAAMKANYLASVLVAVVLGAVTRGNLGVTVRTTSETVGRASDLDSLRMTLLGHPEIAAAVAVAVSGAALCSTLLKILVFNPLQVGCQNFYIRNSMGVGRPEDMKEGFRHWGDKVFTMFLKDLFLFLWALLCIIPGIIKGYSYMMVPYILAEDPTVSGTEAIRRSREMMRGQKWNAFLLDLSFLGWDLLAVLTCGILWIFYVNPYRNCTRAELYQRLKPAYQQNIWQQQNNTWQQQSWQ